MNPDHSLRTPRGIKGTRQKLSVTHNPSEIDQAQELLVRFPNLGNDDVSIPGTANLSFTIELTATIDANRTLVSNTGRAMAKKLAVKFEGNEIMSVDDFDVLACCRDLWKTKSEKRNATGQSIISNDGCTENCIKLRKFYLYGRSINGIKEVSFCCHSNNFDHDNKNFPSLVSFTALVTQISHSWHS